MLGRVAHPSAERVRHSQRGYDGVGGRVAEAIKFLPGGTHLLETKESAGCSLAVPSIFARGVVRSREDGDSRGVGTGSSGSVGRGRRNRSSERRAKKSELSVRRDRSTGSSRSDVRSQSVSERVGKVLERDSSRPNCRHRSGEQRGDLAPVSRRGDASELAEVGGDGEVGESGRDGGIS